MDCHSYTTFLVKRNFVVVVDVCGYRELRGYPGLIQVCYESFEKTGPLRVQVLEKVRCTEVIRRLVSCVKPEDMRDNVYTGARKTQDFAPVDDTM